MQLDYQVSLKYMVYDPFERAPRIKSFYWVKYLNWHLNNIREKENKNSSRINQKLFRVKLDSRNLKKIYQML